MMIVNYEYVTPQFAAEAVYEFVRLPLKHKYERLKMQTSCHSFDKNGKCMSVKQSCRIEFERYEPYHDYVMTVSVDMCDFEGQITVLGAGIWSQYVFPSDPDSLELWLVQFRCFLRKEFQKDKDND